MDVAEGPPPQDASEEPGSPRPIIESISLALRDSIRSVASQRSAFLARSTSSDEKPVAAEEKKPDDTGTCSICMEDATLFTLSGCKHSFCKDCLNMYLEGNITEHVLPLMCPERDCETEITKEDVKQLVQPGNSNHKHRTHQSTQKHWQN